MQNQDWEKAEPLFDRLADQVQHIYRHDWIRESAFWTRKARIAKALGHVEDSRQYLERAVDLNPSFAPAIAQLADLYFDAQNWQAAARYYLLFLDLCGGEDYIVDSFESDDVDSSSANQAKEEAGFWFSSVFSMNDPAIA